MLSLLFLLIFLSFPITLQLGLIALKFKKSNYGIASGNSLFATISDKGNLGEFKTFIELEKTECYKSIYTNIYIPKDDNTTSEIDLIMVTQYGIYVFESKNYGGWIFGKESDKDWMQMFNKKSKFPFYNPIRQNEGHIRALGNYLDLEVANPYKSYIVFGEKCTLKDISVTSRNIKVLKRDQLAKAIKADLKSSNVKILTNEQIMMINRKIRSKTLVDEETKQAHIVNVGKIIDGSNSGRQSARRAKKTLVNNSNKDKSSRQICPDCHSELVLRIAKTGKYKGNTFYGCSKYPKCNYVKTLDSFAKNVN